jgi:acetylornithine deacetylase/succinyl-diaminopimelate desuccinylase-like protein
MPSSLSKRAAASALLLAVLTVPAGAQSAIPAALRPVLDRLRADHAWTLAEQRALCEIPAPPFKEAARAAAFRDRFAALGYADARLDSIGNVIVERAGRRRDPLVILSAHLDTVFPEGTDVTVRTEGPVMRGPGIGDDCRGLAVLLAVARAVALEQVALPGTLVFAGTVGEEGLGNSRGARHLLERTFAGERITAFLSVDLDGFEIVNTHVGSHRYRVSVTGPGGHSYDAFGMPNPVHALGRAIAAIADVPVPATPKTTFSVGVIEGGRGVNAISDAAGFLIDMRSSSAAELGRLDAEVQRRIRAAVAAEEARWPSSSVRLAVRFDTLGVRAAGVEPVDGALVRTAVATAALLGGTAVLKEASTDAAAGTRSGIPSIAIGGGGRGIGAHSLAESFDDGPDGWTGPQWAALLSAALTGLR